MTLEFKLKKAALNKAVDITLKGINKSPERCARNLIELGLAAFPNSISDTDKDKLYRKLVEVCKKVDVEAVKELFFTNFK